MTRSARSAVARLARSSLCRHGTLVFLAATACGGTGSPAARYPNDDALRLEHVQMRGTHNSYHVAGQPLTLPTLNYTLPPLEEQLEMGIRQFELDVHWNAGNGLSVLHLPLVDVGTTCESFTTCLSILESWSTEHPDHQPLIVFVEPKDDIDPVKLVGRDAEIEAEILSVWPRERVVTPDEVRGAHPSLREAILADGWPTLGELRGRALFIAFDSGPFRDAYVAPDPSLAGRILLPRSDLDEPYSTFDNLDDPMVEGQNIRAAVSQGFLIRTRADANTVEALTDDRRRQATALASGAQIISTDFPVPSDGSAYFFDIADGTPSRCNPITAPAFCRPQDIENLGR